jgi:hypothetical protein
MGTFGVYMVSLFRMIEVSKLTAEGTIADRSTEL